MTTADTPAFNDDLSAIDASESLWRTVLMIAVGEAVWGAGIKGTEERQADEISKARRYFTSPNADLAEVCNLAGLDPEAVRERVVAQIEAAPSPFEIVAQRGRRGRSRGPLPHSSQEIAA